MLCANQMARNANSRGLCRHRPRHVTSLHLPSLVSAAVLERSESTAAFLPAVWLLPLT